VSKIIVKEKGFRKLLVWQRVHTLVLVVYRISAAFPKHEVYGLTSQLRRASVSVPANISEGHALGSDAQFLRHLRIAQGSLAEVEYYFVLARDLEYLAEREYNEAESLRSEVGFLLNRLITSVEERRK
jgi:four helix bundle protein